MMVAWSFEEVLIIDVIIYGAGLFLEYISLIKLRMREPGTYRPFKIPLNITGLCLMTLIPLTVYVVALSGVLSSDEGGIKPAIFAICILLTAEVAWRIVRWRSKTTVEEQF